VPVLHVDQMAPAGGCAGANGHRDADADEPAGVRPRRHEGRPAEKITTTVLQAEGNVTPEDKRR
jgi:hypothetical protein